MEENLDLAESDTRSSDLEGRSRKHYNKPSGFSGYRGEAFELKLSALIYARVLNSGLNFRLASNMAELGNFDDIALQLYSTGNVTGTNNTIQTYFIQLKNKKKTKISEDQLLSSPKGDFSLFRYYPSYIEVEKQFESKKLCSWFDGQFEDCLFILYTNADVDKSILVPASNEECLEIFLTDESHNHVLKFNDEDHRNVYQALQNKPKYREFLNQLRIVYKQANEDELERSIMTQIELNPTVSKNNIKFTYTEYIRLLEQWWKQEKKGTFLDESSKLLMKASEAATLSSTGLTELLGRRKSELERLGLVFHESSLQHMKKEIDKSKITHISSVGRSTAPTAIRIGQILHGRSYSILKTQDFVTQTKEVLLAWQKNYFDILVIESQHINEAIDGVYLEINKILDANSDLRKIIFITVFGEEEEQIHSLRTVFGESLKEIIDTWSSSTLIEFSCDLYLEKKVLFQGKKITLSQLLGISRTHILNCLDQESTSLLLVNETPEVGVAVEEGLEYYISRTLSKNCATDASVESVQWCPSSLLDGENRIVIVAAEPGMGKSTFLTTLANDTKEKHPDMWIVRININDYTVILNSIKSNNARADCATQILNQAAGIKRPGSTNLESHLFNLACMHTGNMVVLVDGADEVCPHYKEELFHLLRSLCKTRVRKIWITVRPYLSASLEAVLQMHSYSLSPFKDADQKLFLKKFWKSKIVDVDDEILDVAADHVIELAKKQLTDNGSDFMGIALQCQILGEIFLNNQTLELTDSTKNINLFKLYELYTEKKWNIYLTEKKKDDVTNVNVHDDNKKLFSVFIEEHMLAALFQMLSKEELKKLGDVSKENSVDFVETESMEKKGMVCGAVNGKLQFVHKTFADFFVAKWLYTHFEQSHLFLCNHIADTKYKTVRNILDFMLVTNDNLLHNAILNGNYDKLEKLMDEECEIDKSDDGGRTVLHLSVMYGLRDAIRHLLQRGANYMITDKVLGWSPLDYAFKMGYWQVFTHHLVKYGALLSSCNSFGDTILHIAAEYGIVECFNFVEFLTDLNNKEMPIDARNEYFETPLLRAVQHGRTQVVQFLVERGAGIGIRDKKAGKTVLQIAKELGCSEIVQILEERMIGEIEVFPKYYSDLHRFAEDGELEKIQELFEDGFPVDSVDNRGRTALWCAATKDNIDIDVLNCLVQSGCGIDILGPDGVTALEFLSKDNIYFEAVDFLINSGAAMKPDTQKQLEQKCMFIGMENFDGILTVVYGHNVGTKDTDLRKCCFIFRTLVDPIIFIYILIKVWNSVCPTFLTSSLDLEGCFIVSGLILMLILFLMLSLCIKLITLIKVRYGKLYKAVENCFEIETCRLTMKKILKYGSLSYMILLTGISIYPYIQWILWRTAVILQYNGQLSGVRDVHSWSWSDYIRLQS
ncbi:uncharacterized protein [Periplaneta americana]|uniref:uncharacterized protein n=1 Tax=Periplaneta americana TaxID=6978 RepID=UPI0037E816CB